MDLDKPDTKLATLIHWLAALPCPLSKQINPYECGLNDKNEKKVG